MTDHGTQQGAQLQLEIEAVADKIVAEVTKKTGGTLRG